MSPLAYEAVLPHALPLLVTLTRIAGVFVLAPVFAGDTIPMRVRVLLALALTLIIYPTVDPGPVIGAPPDLAGLAPMVVGETLIGLGIGAIAVMPIIALQAAGQMMGQQMALRISDVFDPASNTSASVIGQFLTFLAITVFLALGGLEVLVGAVAASFDTVPLGEAARVAPPLELLVGTLGAGYELAIRVSTPVVLVIFAETIAVGMVMKTVPQLNILSFGFPVKILAGVGMLAASLGYMHAAINGFVEETLFAVVDWVQGL